MAFDLVKIATSFLVAALSDRLLERPLLSLKSWFPYPSERPRASAFPGVLVPLSGSEKG